MTLLQPGQQYTSLDFDAIRARLIELVKGAFPEWTDFEVASFGNILLEMYAFVGDVLSYYLNAQARESRLATATQRKNVIALCRMLGYRMKSASAATVELVFSLDNPAKADVIIAAGTVVRTEEVTQPVRFQLLQDARIRAGETEARAIAEHSEPHEELFDPRSVLGTDISLDRTPFLDGSAVVTDADGPYEEVESLLGSGEADRHFMVLVDQNDRATLRLRQRPTGTLRVTYKTGGGALGNVESGRLVVIDGVLLNAIGMPVRVMATNPLPASGGADRESIATAKGLAPESLRTSNRTVSREDFEIHARNTLGVAQALMVTSNEDPTVSENTGILYVVPMGGGIPTHALLDSVHRQVTVTYPCTLTFQVSVQQPVYLAVNIDARVSVRHGAAPEWVGPRIRQRLGELFRGYDFGMHLRDPEIAWSDVFNVIRDTDGVRKVDRAMTLNGAAQDVSLRIQDYPVLGTVTLTDSETGGTLP